ncbi:hypothetical protein ES705_21905 [subsurface metagenome]
MEDHNQINQFCNYFLKQINIIESLSNLLYQKLLYASMLDTLGRARYPEGNNRQRIVSFIDNYSGWSDKNRISLVQLSFHLDHVLEKTERNDSKLYKFVHERLSSWKSGSIYYPNTDPLINEISKMALEKEENSVKLARYAELFYTYRNKMVHEFREPGYGIEMSNNGSTPYYHSYINGHWQLVFPVEFFKALCKKCLDGLKKCLLKENVNPYDQYEFSDMWTDPQKLKKKKN